MEFEIRTSVEEMAFNQALGYAWSQQDHNFETAHCDSVSFAHWYSANRKARTLYDAFKYFTQFSFPTQRLMGNRNIRGSYVGS